MEVVVDAAELSHKYEYGGVPVPLVTTLLAAPLQSPGQVSSAKVVAVITGPSGTTTVISVVHTSTPFP